MSDVDVILWEEFNRARKIARETTDTDERLAYALIAVTLLYRFGEYWEVDVACPQMQSSL